MSISTIRFLVAAVLITAGLLVMLVGVIGIFRIDYVLNRMHAAAMGDSLGLLLLLAGVGVMYGISLSTLKLVVLIALFWNVSPVCSHMLMDLEAYTNENLAAHCEILPLSELEKGEES